VTTLEKLRTASTLEDLAALLGYKASGLAFIVYKLNNKYTKFEIPKKSGGVRQLCAPAPQLRTLQKHLANLLYICREQIEAGEKQKPLSHGFRKRHSIITNARPHKRRRYVLKLDLQDFFPSFNFGRVRGFFIKNRHFALRGKVATIIAQIACYENTLPQGSPCSPIIADLIAHPLDVRLAQLAKRNGTTYTRYADDLTFSTSLKEFPTVIATIGSGGGPDWNLGTDLLKTISRAGFAINPAKTRMQLRTSQQLVTGLTVNAKVNVRTAYHKQARAMCEWLFRTGSYFRPVAAPADRSTAIDRDGKRELIESLSPLEGMLSHIYHVKDSVDQRTYTDRRKDETAARRLYARFLFYRYFVRLDRPLIICEGKTDNTYLKCAIRQLPAYQPKLGKFSGSIFESALSFFNHGNQARELLKIKGGTGDLKFLFIRYKEHLQPILHRPMAHPVIVVVDNDDGSKDIFGAIKKNFDLTTGLDTTADFYHITNNLYLVKVPEKGSGAKSCMEDLFAPSVRGVKLGGKTFNPANDTNTDSEYGKFYFAEKVVRPNAATINFANFAPLLDRIVAVIDHYSAPSFV